MDETTRWANGGVPFAASGVDHLRTHLDTMAAIMGEARGVNGAEPDDRDIDAAADRVARRMGVADAAPRDPRNRKARRAARFGRGGAR